MTGVVLGLHVNPNGGVPKHPVDSLDIRSEGCVGDKQNDLKHHGGPRRAVCLLEHRVMERLKAEGHPIQPGSTGENILLDNLPEGSLAVGAILAVGNAVLAITGDAVPCKTIGASFTGGTFNELSHKRCAGQTRWYASVVKPGTVYVGDEVSMVNGDGPTENQ